MFVGFNATFLPMGFMGLEGMARRVYTYPPIGHLPLLNAIATAGAVIMAIGVVVFFVDVLTRVYGRSGADAPVGNESVGRLHPRMGDDLAAAGIRFESCRRFAAAGHYGTRYSREAVGIFACSAGFALVIAIVYWWVAHEETVGTVLLGGLVSQR